MSSKIVELTVAAEKDMMLVVRMTTSGVLSRTGLTLDDLDDMKMAVDEACTCLISQPMGYARLALRYECESEWARVQIAGCCASESSRGQSERQSEQDDDILRCVLESMADRVEIKRTDSGIAAIELQKSCVNAAGAMA